MRNFIKNHTPQWWDGWCWFALGMLGYSVFWVVFGSIAWTRGFQAGMVMYWLGFLGHRAIVWHSDELLKVYRELNQLDNKIMSRQRDTIALKNETIKVQLDHIETLKGNK